MDEHRPQSRLMVLMFTDVVGSVDIKRRLGDAAAARLINRHDELFRKTVSAFPYGEILKDVGDGFLSAFSSASDAVHAALHFQEVLHNEPWDGERLKVRIGLHLGEVSELDIEATSGRPKLSGLAVDIAARIMGLCLPGQILMTRAAFDNARQYVREIPTTDGAASGGRRWIAHGLYQFKGADEPVEVFEVGDVGIAPLAVPPDSEKAKRSVAADQEETLGWRPAGGMEIPDRKGWVVERKLGEGGFGEVWLGEHPRTGAKRVFKFCFDAERLKSLKREIMLFRLLRDALGDRNDIAKLHDVQIDHPPFYIESEFSEDGSIDEWAGQQGGIKNVPLATRLDLVAKTALAVAAAHSVGVLHKDIKPANILIFRGADGAPMPRLTDFGIGVLTDPSRLDKHKIMMTGGARSLIDDNVGGTTGTQIYTPPESLVGKQFTMQGDVYALGIVLYQMVVGDLERPLAQGWEADVADPLLRDDIAKCVLGDETHRLGSAKELADRLMTLPARRRALRRRQIGRLAIVSSAVLVGLLLVVGLWLFNERGLRMQTQEENRKKTIVTQYVQDMFTSVDPRDGSPKGRNVLVADQLDDAVRQLDEGYLRDDPATAAHLRAVLGTSYRALQLIPEAETQLTLALEKRRAILPNPHADTAQSLLDLGNVRYDQGKFPEAEKLYRESLDMRRALFGEKHLAVAESLNYLAAAIDRQEARHAEAEPLYRQALELRTQLIPRTKPDGSPNEDYILVARGMNNLGTCLRAQGRPKATDASIDRGKLLEALEKFTAATETNKWLKGDKHIDVASGLHNQAMTHAYLGDYDTASRLFDDALELKLTIRGENHLSVADTLHELARSEQARAKLPEAEGLARRALAVRVLLLPDGHPSIRASHELLNSILAAAGRPAEAIPPKPTASAQEKPAP